MPPEPFQNSLRERWLWPTCLLVGIVAALPYLLFSYLPLTDLPVHQLSLATWAEPERFAPFYERQSYWLPYWTPLFVARPFVGLLGVEAAGRLPVFLYVASLPLTSALLARAAGRSGYWGLLLAAFALEFNLAWGFVAYCLAGVLLQVVLACALFSERAPRPGIVLGAQALAATVLGFTHPQMAVAAVGGVALLAIAGSKEIRPRRVTSIVASLPALVPSLVYFSDAARASAALRVQGGMTFASAGELLRRLPEFSIDVFDGYVEESLLACAVLLLALSWRQARRPSFREMRIPFLAIAVLVVYFVAPFDWNGQAVGQRLPFVTLLCLPAFAAPGRIPALPIRAAILAIAVVGAGNVAMVLRLFDRETAAELDPLIASAPAGIRTAYLAYDAAWPGIRSLPYLHTGAYVTLRKGGVYAFHFNRLNTRYRPEVPAGQTLIGKELVLSRLYTRKGEIVVWSREDLAFWDTFLVRFPRADEPFVPVRARPDQIVDFRYGHRFGLLQLAP